MMENKTAEEIVLAALEGPYVATTLIAAMKSYASQQCLDMQARIEFLEGLLSDIHSAIRIGGTFPAIEKEIQQALNSKQ